MISIRAARRASPLLALSLLSSVTTAHAAGKWVLWQHSYEVWVDGNKESHRRDGGWRKVTAMASKSDCADRSVREAQAEYHTLTGRGVGATLAGSKVGFDQRNTRYKHGYRSFECWPDTADPRRPKAK